jgi:hypothetical protein
MGCTWIIDRAASFSLTAIATLFTTLTTYYSYAYLWTWKYMMVENDFIFVNFFLPFFTPNLSLAHIYDCTPNIVDIYLNCLFISHTWTAHFTFDLLLKCIKSLKLQLDTFSNLFVHWVFPEDSVCIIHAQML